MLNMLRISEFNSFCSILPDTFENVFSRNSFPFMTPFSIVIGSEERMRNVLTLYQDILKKMFVESYDGEDASGDSLSIVEAEVEVMV